MAATPCPSVAVHLGAIRAQCEGEDGHNGMHFVRRDACQPGAVICWNDPPAFTITAVPRFLVTCDVLDCQWRQEHRTQDSAARDGQRHLNEWHRELAESWGHLLGHAKSAVDDG